MRRSIDPAFARRQSEVFGDAGRDWIARLPSLLDAWCERWSITLDAPYALSYNYVAPATRGDGTRVVLKAGVPHDDIAHEFAALRHWDGDGAVRVLESDTDAGVALLEHVEPGEPILSLDDDAATQIAAGLMRRVAAHPLPTGHAFPTVADWGRAFALLRARHDGRGLDPVALYDRGEVLYRELALAPGPRALLHGDLHHYNILRATREPWLIIDPHGVIGPPAFEVGTWMRNPMGLLQLDRSAAEVRATLNTRLGIFAEALGIDRALLRDWSIAVCCLSAAWSDESSHDAHVRDTMQVAQYLSDV